MIAPSGFVNAQLFAILCILRPYVLCSVVRCDAAKCIACGDKSSASLSAPSVRESRYNACLRPRVSVTVDGGHPHNWEMHGQFLRAAWRGLSCASRCGVDAEAASHLLAPGGASQVIWRCLVSSRRGQEGAMSDRHKSRKGRRLSLPLGLLRWLGAKARKAPQDQS